MNKDLIQQRFSKTLNTYEENARIQKKMAEKLVSFLNKNNYTNILEIGCGTGFLTKEIVKNISFKQYLSLDIVKDCESFIKNINPKINFITADIEEFLKNNNQKFDLIISNASLQWVNNFQETIELLEKSLTEDGELIFSTFGKENFREIYHLLGTGLNYKSPLEIKQLFNNLNISSIEEEIHIMAFKTPKDVLKHLQLTGVNAIENKSWTKTDLLKFENGYKNLCSTRPTLTYNPIYIKILASK